MVDTSYEFLTKFFEDYLPFTPTPRQVDEFQADLSLVSPYLMEAALVEVKNGRRGSAVAANALEWRPAIFEVYNRKVAEHAQLFSIFHSFETAFRSTLAVTLEKHYQHRRWWRKIYEELRAGRPAAGVREIGTTVITRDIAHSIGEVIYSIDGKALQRANIRNCNNGFQFAECCDLSHIKRLISDHWLIFAPLFTRGSNQLSHRVFVDKFDRVREARNDIYHHKSVARMTDVVASAEDLLDYLNFSLSFVYAKIAASPPVKPTFTVPAGQRHRIW